MKKILIVSNMYPSMKYPHYGVFVKNSKEVLESNGYKVLVISLKKEDNKFRKLLGYFMFYTRAIIHGLGNYDAIYAHYASHVALPLLVSRKLKKIPIVLNIHGNDVVPEDKRDQKYIGLVKRLVSVSDYVICPSQYFYNVMRNEYHVETKKLTIYPSGGVDTSLFVNIDRNDALEKLGLDKSLRYIGYVSRIEINKGWDIYLQACAKILEKDSGYALIVVGGGAQEEEYNSLVETLGIGDRIIKYDLASQEKLRYLYNAMDLFIFPTYRKSESLGLVGLEAMACETLTILPNQYGPSSYGIDNENCIMFESGNQDSLYAAIERTLNMDKSTVQKIKENGRVTALEFDTRKTKSQLIDIFERTI